MRFPGQLAASSAAWGRAGERMCGPREASGAVSTRPGGACSVQGRSCHCDMFESPAPEGVRGPSVFPLIGQGRGRRMRSPEPRFFPQDGPHRGSCSLMRGCG